MRHLALQRGSLRLAPWRSSSVAKPPSITAQPPHCFRKSVMNDGDALSRVPSPMVGGGPAGIELAYPIDREMPEKKKETGGRNGRGERRERLVDDSVFLALAMAENR